MGSDFYTIDQAMNRLGKSKRSIYNYIRMGYLLQATEGKVKGVKKSDVEQLAIDQGSDAPAMNRSNWFKMNAKLARLEQAMIAVEHILEIRSQPLRPGPNEGRGLLEAAKNSLSYGTWELREVEMWAGLFDRFDEATLKTISVETQDSLAWQPFFKLCVAMMNFTWALHTQKPTLESQALHQKLDEGRKKLRNVVHLWISSGEGPLPEAFLASLETPKETVARRLGAGTAKA